MTKQQSEGNHPFASTDKFVQRHIGPDALEITEMLGTLGCTDLETLVSETIPPEIRTDRPLELIDPAGAVGLSEHEALDAIQRRALRDGGAEAHARRVAAPRRVPPLRVARRESGR